VPISALPPTKLLKVKEILAEVHTPVAFRDSHVHTHTWPRPMFASMERGSAGEHRLNLVFKRKAMQCFRLSLLSLSRPPAMQDSTVAVPRFAN
jgi:hypothetical protein